MSLIVGDIVHNKYLIILSLFLFFACSKESDTLPPSVTFSSPIENSLFNIPAEIFVSANIQAEGIIESVGLRLVGSDYSPKSEQELFYPNSSSFELEDYLNIEDVYLESGSYFVEVTAVSGGETKRKYRAIQLAEHPREYEGVVLSHQSGAITRMDGILDTMSISEVASTQFNYPIDLIVSNNYDGQFIVAYSNGLLVGIDKNTEETLWEYFEFDPIFQTFYNDVHVNEVDRSTYFSTNMGDIIGFDGLGNLVREIALGDNVIADEFYIDNDVIICEVIHGPGDHRIKVISLANGAVLTQKSISMDVSNILKIDEGQYIIAGSGMASEDNQIEIFHSEINAFFSPNSFDVGEILDVVETSNGIALAHSSGVFMYDPDTDLISFLTAYPNVNELAYDEVNNMLVLASPNQFAFYSLSTDSEIYSYYFADQVIGIDIIYNK